MYVLEKFPLAVWYEKVPLLQPSVMFDPLARQIGLFGLSSQSPGLLG